MMATKIYETETISLIDGRELYITPLKLKYLRDFMEKFNILRESPGTDSLEVLVDCVLIGMRQYCPSIKTSEDVEDLMDLKTLYKIIKISSGIDLDPDNQKEEPESNKKENKEASWENFDLLKLESEVFLLGIWKNFEDLEENMSLPEITSLLEFKREIDYSEKKFLAAMQGIDLDENQQESNAWEDMKARVASKVSGIEAVSGSDITSFQGVKAQQAGFGIGMGIDYEKI